MKLEQFKDELQDEFNDMLIEAMGLLTEEGEIEKVFYDLFRDIDQVVSELSQEKIPLEELEGFDRGDLVKMYTALRDNLIQLRNSLKDLRFKQIKTITYYMNKNMFEV